MLHMEQWHLLVNMTKKHLNLLIRWEWLYQWVWYEICNMIIYSCPHFLFFSWPSLLKLDQGVLLLVLVPPSPHSYFCSLTYGYWNITILVHSETHTCWKFCPSSFLIFLYYCLFENDFFVQEYLVVCILH